MPRNKNGPVTVITATRDTRLKALELAKQDGRRLRVLADGGIAVINPGVKVSREWLTNASEVHA